MTTTVVATPINQVAESDLKTTWDYSKTTENSSFVRPNDKL